MCAGCTSRQFHQNFPKIDKEVNDLFTKIYSDPNPDNKSFQERYLAEWYIINHKIIKYLYLKYVDESEGEMAWHAAYSDLINDTKKERGENVD